MIGRGGIINPFLPEEIKGLKVSNDQEKRQRFYQLWESIFVSYSKELSGPGHLMDKMKEYWKLWSKAFQGGDELFLAISRTRKPDKYQILVDRFFQKKPKLLI